MKRTIFYVKLKIPSFSGEKKISEDLAPWGASPPDRNWLSSYVGVAVSTSWFLLEVEVKVKLLLPGHRAYDVALLILEKEIFPRCLHPERVGVGTVTTQSRGRGHTWASKFAASLPSISVHPPIPLTVPSPGLRGPSLTGCRENHTSYYR